MLCTQSIVSLLSPALPIMSRRTAVALAIAMSLLGACSLITDASTSELAAARLRWTANGAASYDFTVYVSCECLYRPVIVVVANGVVRSRKYADTGADVAPTYVISAYSTIEGLFDFVESVHAKNPAQLDVTYDPVRGFPTIISIDYNAKAVDDEIVYSIRDFHLR